MKVKKLEDRRVFTYNGKEYAVRRPTMQEINKANELRRKTFNDELAAGSLLREQMDEELRKRKLWSDDREARYQLLKKEIIDDEYKLAKGGIPLREAKTVALNMKRKRQEMVEMLSSRTELDSHTCEGKADAIRFNYLFSQCLVYNETNEPYFKGGLEEYSFKQEDPVALLAASEFFYLISDTDDIDSRLPENKFLKKYKFTNDEYQLVDKDGRLVDVDGRHVDENGNFIQWISDTEFVKVDIEGRPLDDENNFQVEHDPFLDDDGNPIDESLFDSEEGETEEKSKPKTRSRRKKNTDKVDA